MTNGKTAAVVLAAGMGTRMKSAIPKVAHPIAGRPMVAHVLAAAAPLAPDPLVVVIGPDMDSLAALVAPHPVRVQPLRRGTADAVKAARADLAALESGTVFILYGDTPFIRTETLRSMAAQREAGAAVVVLGFRPADPKRYGRLVLDAAGRLTAIVEANDATDEQLKIDLCNSGVMAVDAAHLLRLLDRVGNANAKGEYYLTDIVALARAGGLSCAVVEAPEEELLGVDDRAALARAEALWQGRRREAAMAAGATLLDPATVWFSHDTDLAADVTVGPNVVFGPGV
ncbi:MAG: NTP transferase domain-containing protein, partial [Alphaproteobacteria bacterium]